jgi:predicted RNA binding protein YcfA (HicA-like mRNA interferase family)
MRLPRDVSGEELAKLLGRFGYAVTRRSGSHIRLTTSEGGEHHVTIPGHSALRVGTLSAIVGALADHFALPRGEVRRRLFGD